MNNKTILLLLLTACLVGCRSVPVTLEDTRVFKNWKECFRFIAKEESLPTDDNTLFKLAAESSSKRHLLSEKTNEQVVVIKADYYWEKYSQIRGAQDNGRFYVFRIQQDGFTFAGALEGNGYTCGTMNGVARFYASSHWSAFESLDRVYDWNGTVFENTSCALYRYEQDGSKRLVKDYGNDKTNLAPEDTAPKLADPHH
jgi:hypothetical protein